MRGPVNPVRDPRDTERRRHRIRGPEGAAQLGGGADPHAAGAARDPGTTRLVAIRRARTCRGRTERVHRDRARRRGLLLVPVRRAAGRVSRAVLRQRHRSHAWLGGPAARNEPAAVGRAGQGLGGRAREPRPHVIDRSLRSRAGAAGERSPDSGRGCPSRRRDLRTDPGPRANDRLAARVLRGRGPRAPCGRDVERPAATRGGDPRRARAGRCARQRSAGDARRDQARTPARTRRRGFHDRRQMGKLQPPGGDAARRGLQRGRGRARHVQGPAAAESPRRPDLRGHDRRRPRHRRDAGIRLPARRIPVPARRAARDAAAPAPGRRCSEHRSAAGPGSTSTSRSTSARARTSAGRPRRWSSRWKASAASRATGRRDSRNGDTSVARRS